MKWEQRPLGSYLAQDRGSIEPSSFASELFDLYSIPAYDDGKPELVLGRNIGSTKQTVRPGDVLLSKIVPHLRRAWVVEPNRGHRTIASGEWIVFRSVELEPSYLRHVLLGNDFHRELMMTVAGVGGSLVRARPSGVARIPIPVPPLDDQRRIAAILDKADSLRAKRRAAIAQLDLLTQSIFLEMFGDPVTNSKGWRNTGHLGDVADIVSGITKGRPLPAGSTREVPYMAVSNVQDQSLNLRSVKTIIASEEEIARYRLLPRDLLLTEGGDPDKLGRGVLWEGPIDDCIHQNHVFRVRVSDPNINPLYLSWLVASRRGKAYFLRSAKQTTGIASINMTQLRGFPMLFPPIDLQRTFESAVTSVNTERARARKSLAALDALFASLQHRAFNGELTATIPTAGL